MKRSFSETLIRIVILLIGLTIAHLGVTLFLLMELGSDPFNVLIQGIFRFSSNIPGWFLNTHGNIHMAVCFLIILALLIIDRSYIRIGTILCMICGGPIIDKFTLLLSEPLSGINSLVIKILINALGCLILSFGMTIVMKSDAGTGPNDLVSIVTADKLKKNFGVIRIIFDLIFVLVGFLMGGSVGIGTLICAFVVGPVANIFLPLNEKWIQKVLKLTSKRQNN